MIVITGTQRSGTSLVASFFQRIGYDLGSELWHDDINGGLEHPDICLAYSEFLDDPTFPFSDFPWEMASADLLHEIDQQVAKFSYLLMNPLFVQLWVAGRGQGDHFLIMRRDPLNVAKSLKASDRFETDSSLLPRKAYQIETMFEMSLKRIKELELSYSIVPFPEVCQEYNILIEATKGFGIDISEYRDEWYDLVEPSKIHHT